MLRIFENRYTKTSRVTELLESLDRAEEINLKIMDSPSLALNEPPRLNLPPPPEAPSEGILTRNPSLRSNFTAVTSSTTSHSGTAPPLPRRPVPPPIPRRPLASDSPTFIAPPNPDLRGFVPVPLDEDLAEAALVTDGMQHHHHYHPNHHHSASLSRDQPHQFPRMPMLSEEDLSADAALVSDGMRPSEHTLPPYQPGSGRMSGHAGESNEVRLSEYVKGQTRAQDMKDSGNY